MKRTNWFDRIFLPITDNGLFLNILERLEGTPARLLSKIRIEEDFISETDSNVWSIKKEIGHLCDLEQLWYKRSLQIINGETHLQVTDLNNSKTHETNHDANTENELIATFEMQRKQLVTVLRNVTASDLEKSALHPRLGTPMRLIDLAFFVAEHDDHHLARIAEIKENCKK